MTSETVTEMFRAGLAALDNLDPRERDQILRCLVSDLRARDPESVSPLTLGPPTDPKAVRDPRTPA